MFRALTIWAAVVLSSGPAALTVPNTSPAGIAAASASPQPSPNDSSGYDVEAERQLLEMANEARAQAGVPPLQMDDGLTQAARQHSAVMAEQQQLSHQFPGEPFLTQRLAATSSLHLDRAGENVSYSPSVFQSEEGLMHSPEHRENILNPAYNIAGFGVMRRGYILYVTQDFGHGLPSYSAQQAEQIVEQNVAHMRSGFTLPQLHSMDKTPAQDSACTMARADTINTATPPGRYVLRYTTMQPESLPASAARAVQDPAARGLAVGTCYARTATYPNGVYWVALVFY
jgi:uncharacterized protein YkwD